MVLGATAKSCSTLRRNGVRSLTTLRRIALARNNPSLLFELSTFHFFDMLARMSDSCCVSETPFVQARATPLSHEAVSSRYFCLRLKCPEVARRAQPGQFVMLACAPDVGGHSEPLLPRPLAILDARGDEIELLYFVAGRGTL